MPPPKFNKFAKTGKLKQLPVKTTTSPEDDQQQFEVELYWCIQQLEESLNTKKDLTPKQREYKLILSILGNNEALSTGEDISKSVKILKSANQPAVKKRQLMRQTFGDYRAKMAEEQRKMLHTSGRVQFKEASDNVKSQFLRKAFIKPSGEEFRFNFQIDDFANKLRLEERTEEDATKTQATPANSNQSNIIPSDNSFRFNFPNIE